MAGGLEWLTKINDFLERVPNGVLMYFNSLSKSAEEMGQSQVDIICRWLAWKVNIMVERKRQAVINSLYEQYGGMMAMLQGVSLIKSAISNPLGAIGGFLGFFAKPFAPIISFVTTLTVEIPRLAANLANIMSALPPEPPSPKINYDAFQLQIGGLSIGDVIGGPGALKAPEEMFPEPTRPFSKEAFNESFETAKATYEDEQIVYKLKDNMIKEEQAVKSDSQKRSDALSSLGFTNFS